MAIADLPEIRTGAVISHQCEAVVFDERMQIFPRCQVLGAEQEIGAHRRAAGTVRQSPARKGVVHSIFFPDARIEYSIRERRPVGAFVRNNSFAGNLLPIQQKGIAGHGNHVAHLCSVIHRDNPIFLNERRAGVTASFRVGVDCIGQISPVD